ncbi:hypothetical protein ACV229_00860 [Burkholderia sp. MR1-5-21]
MADHGKGPYGALLSMQRLQAEGPPDSRHRSLRKAPVPSWASFIRPQAAIVTRRRQLLGMPLFERQHLQKAISVVRRIIEAVIDAIGKHRGDVDTQMVIHVREHYIAPDL